MNIGTTRNGVQFAVKTTEKGTTWRNFPKHLSEDKFSAFAEAFQKVLTVNQKGKTVVNNVMSLVGIYAIASGFLLSDDAEINLYLKKVVSEVQCYWDFNYNESYIALYRARVKTAFIALLNQVDNGYKYKSVSGKVIDNTIRGKITSINGNSGNARENKPSEKQIIKQVCLEIYALTAIKTEKRYVAVE